METAQDAAVGKDKSSSLNDIVAQSAPKAPANRVVLYITRPEETRNCNFWIGLFKKGKVHPQELYEHSNIDQVYYKAVNEGINDDEPILISNTERQPPEHFYLLPLETLNSSPEKLIQQIFDTLTAMAPSRAGLYFSPELLNKEECLQLLKKVLLSCQDAPTKEFYLFAGKHGINSVLNTAIDVKHELLNSIEVLVFH